MQGIHYNQMISPLFRPHHPGEFRKNFIESKYYHISYANLDFSTFNDVCVPRHRIEQFDCSCALRFRFLRRVLFLPSFHNFSHETANVATRPYVPILMESPTRKWIFSRSGYFHMWPYWSGLRKVPL